jgi:hypothetical protein
MKENMLNRIKPYQGIQMEVKKGARNLCRRLGKKPVSIANSSSRLKLTK